MAIRGGQSTANVPPKSPIDDRTCWVCLGTEEDDDAGPVPKEWVRPCRCRGTTKWVHQVCLQRWVDEKQAGNAATPVSCPQCQTQYRIVCEKLNPVFECFEEYDKLVDAFSPLVTAMGFFGCVYGCAYQHGMMSLWQICGPGTAAELLKEQDSLTVMAAVPIIPVALVGSRFIDWQSFLLDFYRKSWSKLLADGTTSKDAAIQREPAQLKIGSDATSLTRLVMGGLLLPTCAMVCGQALFGSIFEEQWKRSVLGGIVFVLGKGIMKTLYRNQQYVRQAGRRIIGWAE